MTSSLRTQRRQVRRDELDCHRRIVVSGEKMKAAANKRENEPENHIGSHDLRRCQLREIEQGNRAQRTRTR